jgi:cation-transporting ATPase 13A1
MNDKERPASASTMTTTSSEGLRNRKQASSNEEGRSLTQEERVEENSKGNVKSESNPAGSTKDPKDTLSDAKTASSTGSSAGEHDPFVLTPLIQRSTFLRLDVAPFLLAYGLLIFSDASPELLQQLLQLDDNHNHYPQLVVSFLFGLVLISHVALVVACQWRVSVQAVVGYQLQVQLSKQQHQQQQQQQLSRWTHCLVQNRQSSPGTAAVAGIVPVQLVVNGEAKSGAGTSGAVVVVNFRDRIFRCALSQPDVDVTLWSSSKTDGVTGSGTTTGATTTTGSATKNEASILRFRPLQYPVNLPLDLYSSWKGHDSLHSTVLASHVYGPNMTVLRLPTFVELLSEQVVAPFFLFQIFCVVLWSLDEYWYYAIFTLMALIMFESTVAYSRLMGLQRLHTAGHKGTQRVWVKRCGSWLTIITRELVPGDVVSLDMITSGGVGGGYQHNAAPVTTVPADILLLQGTAVADEAMLTGESIPQLKQALDTSTSASTSTTASASAAVLDMQQHKESILFAGTGLLATNGDAEPNGGGPPNEGIVGMVLRTGFETTQGSLLRTMAHSSKSADSVHTWDTFVFILLLICCALVAAWWVLDSGWNDERRNRFRLILHVVIIITSVVPPELPMELSLAVTNSVADLMNRCQVYCTELFRIPWAGQVDVCCFDKTGTLTSDEMRLKGVRLFPTESLSSKDEDHTLVLPSEEEEKALPWPVLRIMAACHSLALVGKTPGSPVVGDPLEQVVLNHTGYHLTGSSTVSSFNESNQINNVLILHRFAFSSRLKRMTVLAAEDGGKGAVWALTKGAPETIKELLSKDSLPTDYDEVSFHHMSRGRRVLALAYREAGNIRDLQALKDNGRDSIECKLTFAGFLVLDCPLKPDSKSVISELRKSKHETVMITGDAILTAAEVARQVGIIELSTSSENGTTYRIQERSGEGGTPARDILSNFECVPLGLKTDSKPLSLSNEELGRLVGMAKTGEAAFCISGDILTKIALAAVQKEKPFSLNARLSTADESHILLHPAAQSVLTRLVPLVAVFARHAPHHKEAVVAAFNHGGFYTLMVGDGTNDVGALKRAHVGISIISAPGVESKQREANATISRVKAEKKRERKGKAQKKGTKAPKRTQASAFEQSLRQLQEAQEELDHVELGDASVASPFTSRAVSIRCCKDVIQQGRCTLVTMLQIYKILGINCLVNALVLSKLFLHGVKQGDRQLTVLGLVVAALFYFVTRAEPLPTLSIERPPASVMCVQALLSIALQCAIHFGAILLATEVALSFVDPYDPSMIPDGPFNPNVLNSCTFLLTCLSTINTFAVNYRGRPFMGDLRENKLLYRSIQICYAVLAICALEVFPPFNDLLQLSSMPNLQSDDVSFSTASSAMLGSMVHTLDFRVFMCGLMVVDTILVFAVESVIVRNF